MKAEPISEMPRASFTIDGWFGVDLKNQPPHRHAFIEHLVRSWHGMSRHRWMSLSNLVKRACKRARNELP